MLRLSVPVLCLILSAGLSPFSLASAAPVPAQTQALPLAISGRIIDPSGAPVAGAAITAIGPNGATVGTAVSGADGAFVLHPASPPHRVTIAAAGFSEQVHAASAADNRARTFVMEIAGVHEAVSVEAAGYRAREIRSAMRVPMALRDIPQAVSVVTRAVIADQGMQGIGDVVRYMPGVGIAQGEGNRDTPVLRGNATTADFFVDGVRDDVQYMRDLYNVERVEAVKGPNAMIFGRGGVGGVLNRVTRQADGAPHGELTIQTGSWDNRRVSADVGGAFAEGASARVTGVFEDSESYRAGVGVRRYGVNPTVAFTLGPATTLRASYEYFHDERSADRGVSSLDGRPLDTDPETFFGNASMSPVRATVNAATLTLDRAFRGGISLRNRASAGFYDKFYQNVFPGDVNAAAGTVRISAYNNATDRVNLFNQTDVILPWSTGRVRHTLLAGAEIGRQVTDNFRNTGYFTSLGPSVTAVSTPLSQPSIDLPIEFRQSASDADNHGIATTAALYVQDQIALSRALDVVVGLRHDRFRMDFTNNRTGQALESRDGLWSPRAGIVYRPAGAVSLYASYTRSYLPRAGEQLSSLTASNRTLEPETFRNVETGLTWDVTPGLALTGAVYQLARGNVVVADPVDPARSILIDAQRTRGVEIGWTGHVTSDWSVAGGYAWQQGEITASISSNAQAGASLAQLPRHSVSLWNKYQFHPRLAAGLGVIHRADAFTSTDNRVVLPAFTRADAGVFYDITNDLRAQVNVENLFDTRYYASAHNNTNITPGSPRALRVALVIRP